MRNLNEVMRMLSSLSQRLKPRAEVVQLRAKGYELRAEPRPIADSLIPFVLASKPTLETEENFGKGFSHRRVAYQGEDN